MRHVLYALYDYAIIVYGIVPSKVLMHFIDSINHMLKYACCYSTLQLDMKKPFSLQMEYYQNDILYLANKRISQFVGNT